MKKLLFSIFLLSQIVSAKAEGLSVFNIVYIVVQTDESVAEHKSGKLKEEDKWKGKESEERARFFIDSYLKFSAPLLAEFNIEHRVFRTTPDKLNCKLLPDSEIIDCDTKQVIDDLAKEAKDKYQPHFVVIISDLADGQSVSGANIPIISLSPWVPTATLLHQFYHLLGWDDSYEYSYEDAQERCLLKNYVNSMNVAIISPKKHYNGDSHARGLYSGSRIVHIPKTEDTPAKTADLIYIPWFHHIKDAPGTIIATDKLGTPIEDKYFGRIGLWPSGTCSLQDCDPAKYGKPLKNGNDPICSQVKGSSVVYGNMWRPGSNSNIMGQITDYKQSAADIEPLLREALINIGMPRRKISPVKKSDSVEKQCKTANKASPADKGLNAVKSILEKSNK